VRRVLSGTAAYFAELGRAIWRGWAAFFFEPADPTALGLIRVVVGLLLFWSTLNFGLDLRAYFGSEGWADPAAVHFLQERATPYAWSIFAHVPDLWLGPVWVACLVALVLFTVGLWSRLTAVLAWVIVVSTARRVPVALFGFDQVISTWALYLAVTGASGQAVSLDRFLARWRRNRVDLAARRRDGRWSPPSGAPAPTISANLALRLIQLHLCLIYGMAGLAKLMGTGWWNGTAIWDMVAAAEFRVWDFTWIAAYPWLLNTLTHGSVAFELCYPVLIWVRVLRPLILAMAIALHLGIGLMAPGLTEFGLAMLAGNLAFVSGPWLRSLVTGIDRTTPSARVLYDGACPRCRGSMAFVMAGDPDRLIEPVDLTAVEVTRVHASLTREACMRAMHVVRDDGRVSAGYDAVVALGLLLPMFWPVSLFGSLPGVTQIGRRVYNALAASRPRDVPCTDEACGIHARGGKA
jgi:predicted DCC family thiol-disulfide oxidoreductase YuxK